MELTVGRPVVVISGTEDLNFSKNGDCLFDGDWLFPSDILQTSYYWNTLTGWAIENAQGNRCSHSDNLGIEGKFRVVRMWGLKVRQY